MSVYDRTLHDLPLAIVDVETTGTRPGRDRIVEVCVYRIEAGASAPMRVFDTVVNPHRESLGTEVHGITHDDVDGAPSFVEIAKRLHHAVEDAVLVAHNAAFDLSFLQAELEDADCLFDPPVLCTLQLPMILGMTRERLSLQGMCQLLGVAAAEQHVARTDALATTFAMLSLRQHALQRGVRTLNDLPRLGEWYSCFDTFDRDPPSADARRALPTHVTPLRPRVLDAHGHQVHDAESSAQASGRTAELDALREDYAAALLEAVSDYQLSRRQFERLQRLQRQTGLGAAQLRSVHAQVFSWALSKVAGDDFLDERERRQITLLYECLSQLGWAPGQ